MQRVQLQVTDEQLAHLQRRSAATGESVPGVIRAAIDAQLAADEQQRRVEVALRALEKPAFHSLVDPSESHEESIVRAIEERIGRR
jgi:hypothetical protein